MPEPIADLICRHYEELCERAGVSDVPVSVRSAGVESRPGMFETYLNIKEKEKVVVQVQKVWASTFTPRAVAFCVSRGLPIDCDVLGVAVVKMVNARAAGIGFTIDPVTGDRSKVIASGGLSLGQAGRRRPLSMPRRFSASQGSLEDAPDS